MNIEVVSLVFLFHISMRNVSMILLMLCKRFRNRSALQSTCQDIDIFGSRIAKSISYQRSRATRELLEPSKVYPQGVIAYY